MTDLISRLRALSRHEHDDLTIGDEAAAELEHQQLCIRDLNGILNEKRDENERLREALHFARSDERHYMADRVDSLTKQLLAMEARYMALLKYVADNVAMQPRPLVMTLDAARAALQETT